MSDRDSSPKKNKDPGKRYSPAKKRKILRLAEHRGVETAARESGASIWSIYRWRQDPQLARPGGTAARTDSSEPKPLLPTPPRIQVPESVQRQVLQVWRNNPGFGPSQVRNQLRRVGVRCDTKTVRKILKAHGYSPPALKPPRSREPRRFEASRPLELVQMDVLHFHVHAQRLYLLLALDDHSRFVTGWALLQRESMEDAISCLEESIRRYGKPEAVLTDRGAVFHTWSGIGRFDRFLEAYGVDHILASPGHPQTCGKIEALNRAIQKELLERVEFRNFLDAKAQISRWLEDYNHQRTHQGLGGVLVPADRFYGRADRVLERIESQHARHRRHPVPRELETSEEDRRVSLFQIVLQGDILELWLLGRVVARLRSPQET